MEEAVVAEEVVQAVVQAAVQEAAVPVPEQAVKPSEAVITGHIMTDGEDCALITQRIRTSESRRAGELEL